MAATVKSHRIKKRMTFNKMLTSRIGPENWAFAAHACAATLLNIAACLARTS